MPHPSACIKAASRWPAAIRDTLDGMLVPVEEKTANVAAYTLNIEADAEAIRQAEDKLKVRRRLHRLKRGGRQSTGTTDRKEAEALEAIWRLEAYKAEKWGEQPAHTFEELMIAYLKARDGEIKLPPVVLTIKHLTRMFAGRTL